MDCFKDVLHAKKKKMKLKEIIFPGENPNYKLIIQSYHTSNSLKIIPL